MKATCCVAAVLLASALLGDLAVPQPPDRRVPLADPFILCEKGVYYAYGTYRSAEGIGIAVSADLVRWKMGVGKAKDGFALHKDDSFGEKNF